MFKILFVFSLLVTCALSAYVYIDPVTRLIVEPSIDEYFQYRANSLDFTHYIWPENAFNGNQAQCFDVIDAQYDESAQVYSIQYWYRDEHVFGDTTIATELAIVDLQTLINHAYSIDLWHGNPSCDELRERINENIVKPLSKENFFLSSPDYMSVSGNGLQYSFICNKLVCSSTELTKLLELSGDVFERIKLLSIYFVTIASKLSPDSAGVSTRANTVSPISSSDLTMLDKTPLDASLAMRRNWRPVDSELELVTN